MRSPKIPQVHHGCCVADINAAERALDSVGFTRIQPGAPVPLRFADEPGDDVGHLTAPVLGSPYRTRYVENPRTGQQIDLIEIARHARVRRPTVRPCEGDLTIVIPGQRPTPPHKLPRCFEFRTDVREPYATVHYSPLGWAKAQPFYETILGVTVTMSSDATGSLCGVGGRLEIAVDPGVAAAPPGIGKRYVGGNHFRLLDIDLEAVAARWNDWILPPSGGFGFILGPCGETIELFAKQPAANGRKT